MKILFMGTPEFAKISLEYLVKNNFDVVGAVTQTDKPAGRKMILTQSAVKEYALHENILVYQPRTLKSDEFYELLKNIAPDIIVVVAYGKILPKNVLEFPKYGCVNVHASLLPKYRGAAPINAAIINGEKITGVTTIYMDEGIDTGDMILKESTEIGEDEIFTEIHDRLAHIGGKILVETLNNIKNGVIKREKQPETEISYVGKIDAEICEIDWNMPAEKIHDKIRGLAFSEAAYTWLNGKKLKIFRAAYLNCSNCLGSSAKNGEVIDIKDKIKVCAGGDSVVLISELQLEGGKRLSAKDFMNGRKIDKGMVLGER